MLGKFVSMIAKMSGTSEYTMFTQIYNNSPMRFFYVGATAFVIGAIVAFISVMLTIPDQLALGIGVVVGVISCIPCFHSFSSYRQRFMQCQECGAETEITADDLLSEKVISERKKKWQ